MTSMTSMTALSHDWHDCHAEFKKFEFSGHYKSSAATRRHWLSNTFGNEIGMHWMLLIATLFFNINKSSLFHGCLVSSDSFLIQFCRSDF